ncbi:DUF2314 domain-containing protein [Rubripirellula reticaptiva]|uniref:DUF2314 domain-containing protein n=1 Tax=Rubripirellula reticaptiva TaxID=2528013 RepID=A0A5C6EKN9_9BACT|nr:DUF2314 domain-containing protein [Rubripirellula reticaptiva]TWU49050.1 hypothetical protein Poly59_36630 [Rubripirellula reticaptiva]
MSEDPHIFISPGDDPEMVEASKKARQTFKYFWREMAWEKRRIVPGLELAAVKASLFDPREVREANPGGLEVEHMWLIDIDFDGRQVQGTLINTPHSLKSYQEGQQVKIRGKQVGDWMYVSMGEVCGGFTIDLMRSRMSASERKHHDVAWGHDFGDVGVVPLVPNSYLGGEASKKKGMFSRFKKVPQQPQDYKKVAETEHPMSVNMRDSFEQALQKNPEMLEQADDAHGFTFLHQLALAGSWDGVDVCLKNGADAKKKSNNGMTAMDLAKCLAWKRVMARLQEA